MELSAARSREVSQPVASTNAATASYPPLVRGSMVARPWEPRPLSAWLRRQFRREPRAGTPALLQPWQQVAHRRRIALVWLIILPTLLATYIFADGLALDVSDWMAWLQLGLFSLLSAWILGGFWTGLLGFVTLARGGDPAGLSIAEVQGQPIDPRARTAIVMPICNEHVSTVFAGLRSTLESLDSTGSLKL